MDLFADLVSTIDFSLELQRPKIAHLDGFDGPGKYHPSTRSLRCRPPVIDLHVMESCQFVK